MINSEKTIYLNETEIKPNKAASVVSICTIAIVIICWIANEIDVFHVGKNVMRIGTVISIVVTAVPLIMLLVNRSLYSNPKMKYILMTGSFGYTLSVTTLMTFHTTLMLLFPIFIAMLYRSKALGKYAMFCTFFSTLVSPVLGYVLGTWDIPLFQELIAIGTGGTAIIDSPTYVINMKSIMEIVLYLVIPRVMMVGASSVIMLRVINIGSDHVQAEIMLNRINHRDNLTGLYNQNYFKELISGKRPEGPVGVIFFDVNGLKKLNDSFGHEAGDLLLKRCAESLLKICNDDNINAFRVGGDEFVLVVDGATEPVLIQKISEWNSALEEINRENKADFDGIVCSMASGFACGSYADIEDVINKADAFMYKNKAIVKNQMEKEAENV